ncbi:hypothetical protein VaNZ11_007656, partial [Volvox africanus]
PPPPPPPPPPIPVAPYAAFCDCLSPLVNSNSRWAVSYVGSNITNGDLLFNFKVTLKDATHCQPINYRNGSCCNSTFEGLSLPVLQQYRSAILKAAVILGGKAVGASLYKNEFDYGIRLQLHKPVFVVSLPVGSSLEVTLFLNPAVWSDESKFPCPPSKLDPYGSMCDYWLHGLQTSPGNPEQQLVDVENVPGCCPEGILNFCPADAACVSDLDTSPYTLSFTSRVHTGSRTTFSFQLAHRNLVSACSAMAIDSVLLYVSRNYATTSATATLGSINTAVTTGSLGPLSYLNISMSSYASVQSNVLTVEVDGNLELSDLCVTPSRSSRVCNYVLVGAQRSASGPSQECCPAGEIPATLPSGRRLLSLGDDAYAALEAGGAICAKYDPFSSCFSLAPVEISETFDEGITFAYKLTRTSAEPSCPHEFQVMVSSGAMTSLKGGHGHIWASGVPAGDHFSWLLPAPGPDSSIGSTHIVSFTLRGRNLDRLGRVCTVRGQDSCVFRLLSDSTCFQGEVVTDFLFGGVHRKS